MSSSSEIFRKAAREAFVEPLTDRQRLKQTRIANFDKRSKLFSERLMRASKKAGGNATIFLKKVMIDLLRKVIQRTPVDTGRARAAWAPFLKAENVNVKLSGDPKAISEGIAKGEFVVQSGSKPGILVVNGVNYSVYLEYGSSDQAPQGMVRISMREIVDEIRNAF